MLEKIKKIVESSNVEKIADFIFSCEKYDKSSKWWYVLIINVSSGNYLRISSPSNGLTGYKYNEYYRDNLIKILEKKSGELLKDKEAMDKIQNEKLLDKMLSI